MAYVGWKDVASITCNDVDLKSWLISISGLHTAAVMDDFHPAGAVFPTPLDTGERTADPVVLTFKADGAAGAPAATLPLGTSSTWTMTLATGISESGTYIVSDVEYTAAEGNINQIQITGTPSGTIVNDWIT